MSNTQSSLFKVFRFRDVVNSFTASVYYFSWNLKNPLQKYMSACLNIRPFQIFRVQTLQIFFRASQQLYWVPLLAYLRESRQQQSNRISLQPSSANFSMSLKQQFSYLSNRQHFNLSSKTYSRIKHIFTVFLYVGTVIIGFHSILERTD